MTTYRIGPQVHNIDVDVEDRRAQEYASMPAFVN